MRRFVLVLGLVLVLLFGGVMNVSAATFCSVDPMVGPLTFGGSLGSDGLHAHLSLSL